MKQLQIIIAKVVNSIQKLNTRYNIYRLLHLLFPHSSVFCRNLADFYYNNANYEKCYELLIDGSKYLDQYCLCKKFAFEAEHGEWKQAKKTFEVLKNIQMIFDVKYCLYIYKYIDVAPGNLQQDLYSFLDKIRNDIKTCSYKDKYILSVFKAAISMRMMKNAEAIVVKMPKKNKRNCISKLSAIQEFLGPLKDLADIATCNEERINPLCLTSQDKIVEYKSEETYGRQVVELHIPPMFFWQGVEKSTYSTVRDFYKAIYSILHGMDNVVIVPFHQYNWRHSSRVTGETCFSYHTYTNIPYSNWFHIQESVLKGECTLDNLGYAGFSSLSHDFYRINNCMSSVRKDLIYKNYIIMKKKYNHNNISKYSQSKDMFYCKQKYIFIPLQVVTDFVSQLTFISSFELLKLIIDICPENMKIVVKRHPFCKSLNISEYLEKEERAKRIIVTDASVHSIIDSCEAVFTANSSVGFEALMHLKPVYVSGVCDYLYCVSGVIYTKDNIIDIFNNGFHVNKDKIFKFLYYYNNFFSYNSKNDHVLSEKIKKFVN